MVSSVNGNCFQRSLYSLGVGSRGTSRRSLHYRLPVFSAFQFVFVRHARSISWNRFQREIGFNFSIDEKYLSPISLYYKIIVCLAVFFRSFSKSGFWISPHSYETNIVQTCNLTKYYFEWLTSVGVIFVMNNLRFVEMCIFNIIFNMFIVDYIALMVVPTVLQIEGVVFI